MHLLHQQQNLFFTLLLVLIPLAACSPVKETLLDIRCNLLHQNCTFVPRTSSSTQTPTPPSRTTNRSSIPTTSRQRSTTRSDSVSDFDAFSENLKRAALILAGIALGLGILRVCLMLCKSRSANGTFTNRHSASIQPHIATIEQHQFKPDLPPEYAEAIASMEYNGGKLPSYDELPNEQNSYNNNEGFMSTPM